MGSDSDDALTCAVADAGHPHGGSHSIHGLTNLRIHAGSDRSENSNGGSYATASD